jgi:UDP-N-acetylglucosamine 2-epimerase (non-hydrolysing)
MLDQVLDFFQIEPDYDLNVMRPSQNLFSLSAKIIECLKEVFDDFKADYVFVHGDTTTSMCSAISGFYAGAKICHVEAGLRTFNSRSPFPEEMNRQITSRLADFHFAPTILSKTNLLKENISEDKILVSGNTVVDALFDSLNIVNNFSSASIDSIKSELFEGQDVILITGHRRENHGEGFDRIFSAIEQIAIILPNVKIIYPVHLNPLVQGPAIKLLSKHKNILLISPLPYPDFVWLMNRSKLIITDSGGVQEEAPSLGKPVLVIRDTTERPEAVEAGTVILVGSDTEKIISETIDLMQNENRYKSMSELHNPYGDGYASSKIVKFILDNLSINI